MDVAELVIKVNSLDAKVAEANLRKLGDTSGWLEGMVKNLMAAAAGLGLMNMVKDAALLAARFDTMGVVMDRAGNNAGYTARQMKELEVALQSTGISMLESRNALTQLATANIDLSRATELARIAQDVAKVGNMNSSEAFQKMIHGIKSGQVEVLRTMGINVVFEDSYKKLALQLGKTAAALTPLEKMQAKVNAVAEEGAKYAGIYEDSLGTAGAMAKSMERHLENLQLKLGEIFQPVYAGMVTAFGNALKVTADWVDRNRNRLDSLGLALENTRSAFGSLWATVSRGNSGFQWLEFVRSVIGGIGLGVALVSDGINMWLSILADVSAKMVTRLQGLAGAFQSLAYGIGAYDTANRLGPVIGALSKMATNYNDIGQKALFSTDATAKWMKANREVERMAKEGKINGDAPSRLDIAGKVQSPETETSAVNKEAAKLIQSLQEQIATFGMGKTAIEAYKASLAGLNKEQTVQVQGLLDQLDALGWQQQRVDDARKAEDELTAALEAQSRARIDLLASQRKQLEDDGKRLTEQMMSPAEKQIAALTKLDAMLNGGVIGWEVYNRQLQEIERTGLSTFSTLLNGIDLFAQHGSDAFTQLAMTGKFAWKEMINSIIQDLIRLQSQKAFVELGGFLMKSAGNWFNNGTMAHDYGGWQGGSLSEGGEGTVVAPPSGGAQSIARPSGSEGSNVSITVNLGSGGGSEQQGGNEKGMQLGNSIKNAVLGVIADEQRPGGLLYGRA